MYKIPSSFSGDCSPKDIVDSILPNNTQTMFKCKAHSSRLGLQLATFLLNKISKSALVAEKIYGISKRIIVYTEI